MKTKARGQSWRRSFLRSPGYLRSNAKMTISLTFGGWRIVLLIALLVAQSPLARAQDPTLDQLRVDFAMRYLEPPPHMALAKYYLAHDNRLLAFDIFEAARRGRFEESAFNRAFHVSVRGVDDSKSAEASLLKDLAANPRSEEIIFKLADLYIAREDWPKAKQYLAEGMKTRLDDFRFT